MFLPDASNAAKVPLAALDTASAATISEFENQMQLSINPCLQTAGQLARPGSERLFGNLFAGALDNTSTYSPSNTATRATGLNPGGQNSSLLQPQDTNRTYRSESIYSHMPTHSTRTDGLLGGASEAATDNTRNADSQAVASTDKDGDTDGTKGQQQLTLSQQQRKKRSRSREQLDQNRVAQQKYRDRKKAEQGELQGALDQMSNQLAAYKALEGRMKEMDATNQGLQQVVIQQMQRIKQLEGQVDHQSSTMASQLSDLKEAVAIATRQDAMINEQQNKLQLQEQVILQLKERLKNPGGSSGPSGPDGATSMKILTSIKGAVHTVLGAHGQAHGALDRMKPDDLVMAITQHIFSSCREEFTAESRPMS